MTTPNMRPVPKPLTPEEQRLANERRLRLVAAMERMGVNQSDLHRKLVDLDERTALGTINKWCTGAHPISEVTLRGILSVLGLPADWQVGDDIPTKH
jgi:hypothetical protein